MKYIFYSQIILVLLFAAGCSKTPSSQNRVCFSENQCFDVELAQTQEDKKMGLMFRHQLAEKSGMLFIFDYARPHRFWMKNTFMPLDIIWMDHARRVVHIEHGVPPCTQDPCPYYFPEGNALYVLELGAGMAVKHRIQKGESAEFFMDLN